MENKTTSELLDLLFKLVDNEGHTKEGYDEALDELYKREPFSSILNPDCDESLAAAWDAIKQLREDIKELKRHRHEPSTGDAMIRI